jgi:hypothetical protein
LHKNKEGIYFRSILVQVLSSRRLTRIQQPNNMIQEEKEVITRCK